MKKLHELLCTNRWFAVVLLLEAAVLASLAASLFGAPYRLQLTPADFENEYPQIAAVNEEAAATKYIQLRRCKSGTTTRTSPRRRIRPSAFLRQAARCAPARMR